MEQWKTIPEFSDYAVSDAGNVLRVVSRPFHPPCFYDGWIHSTGCVCVTLRQDGKRKSARVHILVAKAFLPNPLNLPTVNHKDGDKMNNAVGNLEWASSKRQVIHAIQTGLHETRGYSYNKHAKKWIAYIEANGKQYYLGLFENETQAAAARKAAEKVHHNLEDIA